MRSIERVAVVSMGGLFPNANSLDEFWNHVRNANDCSSEPPLGRWLIPPQKAKDPRLGMPDRVYSTRGYFLKPFQAETRGLDLRNVPLEELDPIFHLALHIGNSAFLTAQTRQIDRQRCGVILGNIALPTEKSSEYARQILGDRFGTWFPKPLRPVHPWNRQPAGLPAALLARALGFGLGGYSLDAACASSLYAIKYACDELLSGRADFMIAGGMSRPDCLYTQMGFAQLRALSLSGRCSPFDAKADGLVVGEGGCAFGLKRLRDAIQQGDSILAVIAGIGLSNDREGNLLLPASEGQLRAMRSAYEQAQWSPEQITLFECHATGTPVGDAVEFASLRQLLKDAPPQHQATIGCVKSTVGHLLTGAGAAGLAKVILAIQHRTLPPTANFQTPSPRLDYHGSRLQVLQQAREWDSVSHRRAAVSAFGFGGINAHVLIEEFHPTIGTNPTISVVPPPVSLASSPAISFAVQAVAQQQGTHLNELELPLQKFRIPPKEMEEMLPQQALLLLTADRALTQISQVDHLRTGVYVGVVLDPNTTNFHLRWAAGEVAETLKDAVHPPLTADRTMGALASVAASRLGRWLGVGGPCFAVLDEQAGGLRALKQACEALARHEIDRAIVGAVDLASDVRSAGQADGCAVVVLERLADAQSLRHPILAQFAEVKASVGEPQEPETGAACSLLNFVQACESLRDEVLRKPAQKPEFWLHDTAEGYRSLEVVAGNTLGNQLQVIVQEPPEENRPPRYTERENRPETLFTFAAPNLPDLQRQLELLANTDPRTGLKEQAHAWANWQKQTGGGAFRLAFIAQSIDDLQSRIKQAQAHLNTSPAQASREGIFFTPAPLSGSSNRVAFVYPGSGNHYPDMGRELGILFPEVLHQQLRENRKLASQYHSSLVWNATELNHLTPRDLIFAQVTLGTLTSDIFLQFGVKPSFVLGYSLGESASMFGTRAWTSRDEMYERVRTSPLFVSDLAGPYNAVRQAWHFPPEKQVDWLSGVVAAPPEKVRQALQNRRYVYLLIINTPQDCVIGGQREEVEKLVQENRWAFFPVEGVTAAHCEVAAPVRERYRQHHLLPTSAPEGVRYYSGARGESYELTADSAAESITEAVLNTIDFPKTVRSAYRDGARIFLEMGPGASCTRMISSILDGEPHLALAVAAPRLENYANLLQILAQLHVEGIDLNLDLLKPSRPAVSPIGKTLKKPAHYTPRTISHSTEITIDVPEKSDSSGEFFPASPEIPVNAPPPSIPSHSATHAVHSSAHPFAEFVQPHASAETMQPYTSAETLQPWLVHLVETQRLNVAAHEAFLRFSTQTQWAMNALIQQQTMWMLNGHSAVLDPTLNFTETVNPLGEREGTRGQNGSYTDSSPPPSSASRLDPPRSLTKEQCFEFARGSIGKVLGPLYAEIDSHPTRVRLPDGPLQLVDRILLIEGEPLSLTQGRVVTEHLVTEDRWYLDSGRIPTCVAVESGQADLFLSGFLGIDLRTKGLAVYRLLDARVTFHRSLPVVGDLIRYDIHIDEFFRQGETYLFRFRFESTVNGEPLLSMSEGVAGFFSEQELANGKGIIHTELDKKPMAGKVPAGWVPYAPLAHESMSASQVDALRKGNLVEAFGPLFAKLPLKQPALLPGGMLKLVHRVTEIIPRGGRYGLGQIRAEADIKPDDWFLTCHFVDDKVMPGTLMYECCLHTLRILVSRMGFVGEKGAVVCEPVPNVKSKLKCRGQVISSTKVVTYEVSLKEIGFRPEPYFICDALMYADGKPIVEITDMSLRISGLTRESLEQMWQATAIPQGETLFGPESIRAFAVGKPSEAFGDRYQIFDAERVIARLPGPPYQFLDRITHIEKCRPWEMTAGGEIVAEYDVPPQEWYFAANRYPVMPFSVLLEVALQPCGWLAAYLGSALTSEVDLSFRNLGGRAVQYREVRPDAGTLVTRVRITKVSSSGGMIIQNYDFDLRQNGQPVYVGDTYFGFFSKQALANQIGLREFQLIPPPSEGRTPRPHPRPVSTEFPYPDAMLRMVDRIEWESSYHKKGILEVVEGRAIVNPEAWFFKAHFYQDPVWPGSLGLESLLQILRIKAADRWGHPPEGWQAVALNRSHSWTYRGQILPTDKEVTIQAYITKYDDKTQTIIADGLLSVDGRIIYHMKDFSIARRLERNEAS
jgi:PfaB family protein